MDIVLQELRAKVAWRILTRQAKHGKTITYTELAKEMDVHPHATSHFLSLIQKFCIEEGLPHLTALVVNQSTGLPGAGCSINLKKLRSEYKKIESYPWTKPPNQFLKNQTPTHFWLDQINPEAWDIKAFLRAGNTLDTLRFSVYAKQVNRGDPIFLWMSGKNGGIIGYGSVASRPKPTENSDLNDEYTLGKPIKGKYYVEVNFVELFPENPIPRDYLRKDSIFKNSGIIRFPNGANLCELSESEYFRALEIIDDRKNCAIAGYRLDEEIGSDVPRRSTSIRVQRIVRDSAVTQKVKAMYDFTCQFCETKLLTPTGKYAEGAHIRPCFVLVLQLPHPFRQWNFVHRIVNYAR